MAGIVCYIGIGSNLGNPVQNCRDAIEKISFVSDIQLMITSSFYLTEPVNINTDNHQDWFINAVCEIKTDLSACDLLSELQHIETAMGRKREIKGEPRIIDLDILFYGQDIINEANLNVPHPEVYKRRFVLEPLCEIASFYIHPAFGVSIRGLKDRLKDQSAVELYNGGDLTKRCLC
ncbi:MAG: 2-amino-4-hydroxy-6-hydroxymethyldihydropteridine diphosphokinase [Deltaproteobacteria bacterium]